MLVCLATAALLAGTLLQLVSAFERLSIAETAAFLAVDEMRTEFKWRRNPIKRVKQGRLVRRLLRESPDEAALYRRTRRDLFGWSFLAGGSALAFGVAAVDLI